MLDLAGWGSTFILFSDVGVEICSWIGSGAGMRYVNKVVLFVYLSIGYTERLMQFLGSLGSRICVYYWCTCFPCIQILPSCWLERDVLLISLLIFSYVSGSTWCFTCLWGLGCFYHVFCSIQLELMYSCFYWLECSFLHGLTYISPFCKFL